MDESEEMVALRAELASARTEAADMAERLAGHEARAVELEQSVAALRLELEAACAARRATVARYRESLLAATPELPPELVTGETVDELDAAAQRARDLIARVREQVEAAGATRLVPAGSPARRGPDLTAMTAVEKIRYGIAG